MPKDMLQLVKETLREDDRLSSDGKLLKNKIMELTHKQDEKLIDLLLSNDRIREHFFTEVDGTLVFDKDRFIKFVNNKQFLPDSYTTFKNKIGLTSDGEYLDKKKEVTLVWPYKDGVLEGDQADPDEDRDEIFWNETLAPDEVDRLLDPKVLTNFQRIDEEGEHKNPELNTEDSLLIRGNNLLALYSLKKKFRGKVKLIYIDPPFNKGTEYDDFSYNDSFRHSSWLIFMKNRLEIARELMREDGIIFAHIDDTEQAYLKVLMDEIFGRDNFITTIALRSSTPSGPKTANKNRTIIKQKDFILVYKKGEEIEIEPQYYKREEWDTHYNYYLKEKNGEYELQKLTEKMKEEGLLEEGDSLSDINIHDEKVKEFYLKNSDNIIQLQSHRNEEIKRKSRELGEEIYVDEEEGRLYYNGRMLQPLTPSIKKIYKPKKFENDLGKLICDFWHDIDFQNTQNEGGTSFPRGKKPEMLLSRIIRMATNPEDLVLDFYLGNGTTAAVAHKMNRRYIGIEQLDYGENDPKVRLKNVIDGEQSGISKGIGWDGGGSFVYCELMKWNQRYIDKIEKAETEEELLEIWKEMKEEAFLSYKLDPRKFDENVEEFKELSLEDQKGFLMECLDKNHLYVNLSEIDDEEYDISEEDKKMNKQFYGEF